MGESKTDKREKIRRKRRSHKEDGRSVKYLDRIINEKAERARRKDDEGDRS